MMFQINAEWWQVVHVPPDHPLLYHDGRFALGVCNDTLKTIAINDELFGDLYKKVLCHEITHAAMFSYDVSLDYEQEELIAELIATFGAEIIDITNKLFCQLRGRR